MNVTIKPASGTLLGKSVGIIVKNQDGEYLLLDRRTGIRAWAAPAGHLEEGEDPRQCAGRELEEETGLVISPSDLFALSVLFHNDVYNAPCKTKHKDHEWHIFGIFDVLEDVEKKETLLKLAERNKHRGIGWFSPEEMRHLDLEPVWYYILKELRIL